MLAMGVNDNVGVLNERGACAFIANMLAPAGNRDAPGKALEHQPLPSSGFCIF